MRRSRTGADVDEGNVGGAEGEWDGGGRSSHDEVRRRILAQKGEGGGRGGDGTVAGRGWVGQVCSMQGLVMLLVCWAVASTGYFIYVTTFTGRHTHPCSELPFQHRMLSCPNEDMHIVIKARGERRRYYEFFVALKSMLFSRSCPLHVHVLTDEYPFLDVATVVQRWNIPNLDVHVYSDNDYRAQVSREVGRGHEDDLLVELPYILPHVDKVLVLEPNVMFFRDVRMLWSHLTRMEPQQMVGLVMRPVDSALQARLANGTQEVEPGDHRKRVDPDRHVFAEVPAGLTERTALEWLNSTFSNLERNLENVSMSEYEEKVQKVYDEERYALDLSTGMYSRADTGVALLHLDRMRRTKWWMTWRRLFGLPLHGPSVFPGRQKSMQEATKGTGYYEHQSVVNKRRDPGMLTSQRILNRFVAVFPAALHPVSCGWNVPDPYAGAVQTQRGVPPCTRHINAQRYNLRRIERLGRSRLTGRDLELYDIFTYMKKLHLRCDEHDKDEM